MRLLAKVEDITNINKFFYKSQAFYSEKYFERFSFISPTLYPTIRHVEDG